MKKVKNGRTILLSVITVLLCMLLLVTGTYALFTDTAKISNHLQAGNLNLKLERVGLSGNYLDSKGYMKDLNYSASDVYHHYYDGDTTDIFNTSSTLVAPGFYREATLRLGHEGFNEQEEMTEEAYEAKYGKDSIVAFKYWLELRLDSTITENWKELASQLKITVSTSQDNAEYGDPLVMTAHSSTEDKATFHLYEGMDKQLTILIGSDTAPIGTIGVGENQYFKVKVEFEDKEYSYDKDTGVLTSDNDTAQNQEVGFDLVVYAIQVVTEPSTT